MFISVNSKLIGANPLKESTNQLPNNEFKRGKYSNRSKLFKISLQISNCIAYLEESYTALLPFLVT